jgi:hypothetical protein
MIKHHIQAQQSYRAFAFVRTTSAILIHPFAVVVPLTYTNLIRILSLTGLHFILERACRHRKYLYMSLLLYSQNIHIQLPVNFRLRFPCL